MYICIHAFMYTHLNIYVYIYTNVRNNFVQWRSNFFVHENCYSNCELGTNF